MVTTITGFEGKIIATNDDPKTDSIKMANEMDALSKAASDTAIKFDKVVFYCGTPNDIDINIKNGIPSDYEYKLIGMSGVNNKEDEFHLEKYLLEAVSKHRESL